MSDDLQEWARRKREEISKNNDSTGEVGLTTIVGGVASVLALGGAAYYLLSRTSTKPQRRGRIMYQDDFSDDEDSRSDHEDSGHRHSSRDSGYRHNSRDSRRQRNRAVRRAESPEKGSKAFNNNAYELVEDLIPMDDD